MCSDSGKVMGESGLILRGLTLLLPLQGVPLDDWLPRVSLRLPWAKDWLGFQPVRLDPVMPHGNHKGRHTLRRSNLSYLYRNPKGTHATKARHPILLHENHKGRHTTEARHPILSYRKPQRPHREITTSPRKPQGKPTEKPQRPHGETTRESPWGMLRPTPLSSTMPCPCGWCCGR